MRSRPPSTRCSTASDHRTTARARLHIDRVFTIKGAGTVVTGTLSGDCLGVGDEVELYPAGARARIRSLQTHKQSEDRACPVSRVAANLVGVERDRLGRGDVLASPAAWRPTRVFEARLHAVGGRSRAVTARGAFKLYVGAAEVDARVRFYGTTKLEPGAEAFVRITATTPLVLDVGDRFVVREAGRRETVAGGTVLDVAPPARAGPDPVAPALRARHRIPRRAPRAARRRTRRDPSRRRVRPHRAPRWMAASRSPSGASPTRSAPRCRRPSPDRSPRITPSTRSRWAPP